MKCFFKHKTEVTILDRYAYMNVMVKCTKCKKILHDIDSPTRLNHER